MTIQKAIIFFGFALWLVACNTDIDVRRDHYFNYLTVTIPEADASKMVETILQADTDSDFQEPQAELQPGEIVVTGKVRQPDSDHLTPGSFRVRLWVEKNTLQAEIISVDFAGWEVSAEELAWINEAVTKGLSQSIAPKRTTILQGVTISDQAIVFVFRTPRR